MDLVSYESNDKIELYRGHFLIPADWKSKGVVIHVFGGIKLRKSQPVALAITETILTLCDKDGPVVEIPLQSVKSVQLTDLTGISLPVSTPTGVVDMVPARAKGVAIKHESILGAQLEVVIYTLSPNAAFEWVNIILEALQNYSSDVDSASGISRR